MDLRQTRWRRRRCHYGGPRLSAGHLGEGRKNRRPTSPIIAKIIVAAAGAEVKKYLYGHWRWDDKDRELIAHLLTLLPESLRREDRLRRFAQQLVRHHYNAISFVAGYLAEKLELTGAEIDVWMSSAWIARTASEVRRVPATPGGTPNAIGAALVILQRIAYRPRNEAPKQAANGLYVVVTRSHASWSSHERIAGPGQRVLEVLSFFRRVARLARRPPRSPRAAARICRPPRCPCGTTSRARRLPE